MIWPISLTLFPIITVILLALGVVGVMIYERTRLRQEKKQDT